MKVKKPEATRNQIQDTWLVQPVLCHWATTTRQPPAPTILYMYCTGGTEMPQLHTRQPPSMCCQNSIRGQPENSLLQPLFSLFQPLMKFWQHMLGGCWVAAGCAAEVFQSHLCSTYRKPLTKFWQHMLGGCLVCSWGISVPPVQYI